MPGWITLHLEKAELWQIRGRARCKQRHKNVLKMPSTFVTDYNSFFSPSIFLSSQNVFLLDKEAQTWNSVFSCFLRLFSIILEKKKPKRKTKHPLPKIISSFYKQNIYTPQLWFLMSCFFKSVKQKKLNHTFVFWNTLRRKKTTQPALHNISRCLLLPSFVTETSTPCCRIGWETPRPHRRWQEDCPFCSRRQIAHPKNCCMTSLSQLLSVHVARLSSLTQVCLDFDSETLSCLYGPAWARGTYIRYLVYGLPGNTFYLHLLTFCLILYGKQACQSSLVCFETP